MKWVGPDGMRKRAAFLFELVWGHNLGARLRSLGHIANFLRRPVGGICTLRLNRNDFSLVTKAQRPMRLSYNSRLA